MKKSIAINQRNLEDLPSNIKVPTYDRNKVKTGIVHIGVGNFHRSHQAFYTNELLENHGDLGWGICGIGLLDHDRKINNVLKDQDGYYSLITKEMNGTLSVDIIGSIVKFIFAPENSTQVIEKIANSDTKIVSLTITEGGYNLNEATGEFDFTNPVIIEDMKKPPPKTVFGYLTHALKLRKQRNVGGLTILSCDNVQGNGDVAKKSLLDFISKAEPDLLQWAKDNVSFPNSMVDRITPVTVADDKEKLKDEFFIEDQWPVVCEPFKQWVIEDNFKAGRPDWDKVGVEFVKDVLPYENMKLRLLNAGHSILGILGAIHGYKTIDEAARDEHFHRFLRDFMDKEASPTLGDLGNINLEEYKDSLIQRFQNIYIRDLVIRICLESSAKIPIFLLNTVREQLKKGGSIDRAAFLVAGWCRYNDGVDEKGNDYVIEDAMSSELIRATSESHQNPISFLELENIFGDLSKNEVFVEKFLSSLEVIRSKKIKDCIIELNEKLDKE